MRKTTPCCSVRRRSLPVCCVHEHSRSLPLCRSMEPDQDSTRNDTIQQPARSKRKQQNSPEDGGSPWKAMKRLRVADENNKKATNKKDWWVTENFGDLSATTTTNPHLKRALSSPTVQQQQPPLRSKHNVRQRAAAPGHILQQQLAGQSTADTERKPSAPRSRTFSEEDAAAVDMDYQSVNNILGALHLERRRGRPNTTPPRRRIQQQQEQKTPVIRNAAKPLLTTPPPRKNRSVRLHTTSKLG